MDPGTHTLIGVEISNAFVRRRIGFPVVSILAVAALYVGVCWTGRAMAENALSARIARDEAHPELVVERPPPFVFRFLVGGHGILRRWDGEGRP